MVPTDTVTVAFTKRGYLIIGAELARTYFPTDAVTALQRGRELWVLPVSNRAAGGLLLKQRNTAGDRSVLVWHVMPNEESFDGSRPARWDAGNAALRIDLDSDAAA
jgi:hydrogenase maturation protease